MPDGVYGPGGISSADVTVVFVIIRFVRLPHVRGAPIANVTNENIASRKGQIIAKYDDKFPGVVQ
jgi:hypothetical protein